MKKQLLLLPAFVLGISCMLSAQEPGSATREVSPVTSHMDSLETMTLEEVYAVIDSCDVFQINGLNEQFTYKARVEPTERNKAILQYIRNRKTQLN